MSKDKPDSGGRRKDGKPYKEGNTREDGSYAVGKYRPSVAYQFSSGDGRKRGTRGKGRKNLLTEWREELEETVILSEGGKTKKVSKRRAVIKSQIDRGMKKSDRAAESVLRYAELSDKRDPGLQVDDLKIISLWLQGMQQIGDSDDLDGDDEHPSHDGEEHEHPEPGDE